MCQHTFAFAINALFSQSDCIQLYLNECFVFDREWEQEGGEKENENGKCSFCWLKFKPTFHICLLIWYRFQRVKIANLKFYAIDISPFADHFRYNLSRLNVTCSLYACAWYVIEASKSYHGNIILVSSSKETNQPDSVCIQKHTFSAHFFDFLELMYLKNTLFAKQEMHRYILLCY